MGARLRGAGNMKLSESRTRTGLINVWRLNAESVRPAAEAGLMLPAEA